MKIGLYTQMTLNHSALTDGLMPINQHRLSVGIGNIHDAASSINLVYRTYGNAARLARVVKTGK